MIIGKKVSKDIKRPPLQIYAEGVLGMRRIYAFLENEFYDEQRDRSHENSSASP